MRFEKNKERDASKCKKDLNAECSGKKAADTISGSLLAIAGYQAITSGIKGDMSSEKVSIASLERARNNALLSGTVSMGVAGACQDKIDRCARHCKAKIHQTCKEYQQLLKNEIRHAEYGYWCTTSGYVLQKCIQDVCGKKAKDFPQDERVQTKLEELKKEYCEYAKKAKTADSSKDHFAGYHHLHLKNRRGAIRAENSIKETISFENKKGALNLCFDVIKRHKGDVNLGVRQMMQPSGGGFSSSTQPRTPTQSTPRG